jgi:predicted Rossmann fold nucleotide-binding protein DprA/Smf involved in DNA uptake
MKQLQNQLKSVSKSLAALSKKVEKLSQQVGKSQATTKSRPARQATGKKKTAATTGAKTVLDTVYDAIRRSKKGVTVSQLKDKTDLDARQLSNALYKLSKKGQVYAKSRGLYVKK